MKKILITLSLSLLISKMFASTYSLYVIEDHSKSFDKNTEIPLQTLLAKTARIKVFVQTTGVSSAEEPGTVQTYSITYVEKSDDNKTTEIHQKVEVGTRFRVVEDEGSISVEFSHREVDSWIADGSRDYLMPIIRGYAANTDLTLQNETATIVGLLSQNESRENNPPKRTKTMIILVRGSPDKAHIDLRNLFPTPNNSGDDSLKTGPTLIRPGDALRR